MQETVSWWKGDGAFDCTYITYNLSWALYEKDNNGSTMKKFLLGYGGGNHQDVGLGKALITYWKQFVYQSAVSVDIRPNNSILCTLLKHDWFLDHSDQKEKKKKSGIFFIM